jgi:hypothetical protein
MIKRALPALRVAANEHTISSGAAALEERVADAVPSINRARAPSDDELAAMKHAPRSALHASRVGGLLATCSSGFTLRRVAIGELRAGGFVLDATPVGVLGARRGP